MDVPTCEVEVKIHATTEDNIATIDYCGLYSYCIAGGTILLMLEIFCFFTVNSHIIIASLCYMHVEFISFTQNFMFLVWLPSQFISLNKLKLMYYSANCTGSLSDLYRAHER